MRFLLFLLTILLFSACQPKAKPVVVESIAEKPLPITVADSFSAGKLYTSVALRGNAAETFTLYLPKLYSYSAKLPLVVFFDPHGDGSVPLALYQSLADKYNCLLLASNLSKNGMNAEQTNAIAGNLIAEAKSRFHVDEKRIALAGFSGGAKVALMAACANEGVSSVVYCGAATNLPPNARNFALLGFAGKRDMNYSDVILFDQAQNSSLRRHCLLEHPGKHEWPDEKTFENAFLFLEKGTAAKKCFELSPDLQRVLASEQQNKQVYIQAFQTKDLNWWKQEIASLNLKKKNDLIYERLLGFISLACYSYANSALQQNNLPLAEHILSIYAMADPGNKDCEAFTAELRRRK